MKMKLITDIHFLKQKSSDITDDKELKEIMKDLEDTLDTTRGIGLSAVQIGIAKRAGVVVMGKTKIKLVNPIILDKEDRFKYIQEGCLSVPGLFIDTARYRYVTFETGLEKRKKFTAMGIEAVAIQHEIDHMNGLLFLDKKWRKRR